MTVKNSATFRRSILILKLLAVWGSIAIYVVGLKAVVSYLVRADNRDATTTPVSESATPGMERSHFVPAEGSGSRQYLDNRRPEDSKPGQN